YPEPSSSHLPNLLPHSSHSCKKTPAPLSPTTAPMHLQHVPSNQDPSIRILQTLHSKPQKNHCSSLLPQDPYTSCYKPRRKSSDPATSSSPAPHFDPPHTSQFLLCSHCNSSPSPINP